MTGSWQAPPPGSTRLLVPAGIAWAVAAIAVGAPGSGAWLVAVGGAGASVLLVLAILQSRAAPRPALPGAALALAALPVAVVLLLGARILLAEQARASPVLERAAAAGRTLELVAEIEAFPRRITAAAAAVGSQPQQRFWVRASGGAEIEGVPLVLWLDGASVDARGWAPGTAVRIRAEPVSLEPGSWAAFGLRVRAGPPMEEARAPGALAPVAELRRALVDASSRVPGAALVPGLAVGDTSLVTPELADAMRESSLTHLVAVSGSNCALITGAVIAAAVRLGAGRRLRIVLGAGALAAFVLVVGPDASVQRAAIMAGVVLVSGFGGKRSHALPALAVAMLVMLLADPWQSREAGFGLSVAATAGILLLATPLQSALLRVLPLPRWLALSLAVAVSAQLACGPLLLLLEPGVPVVGVAANVIAAPAAPVGTALGLVALLLAPLGAGAIAWLGELAVWLASLPARWIAATAAVCAGLPLGRAPWPGGWGGALLLALCEALFVAGWAVARGGARWVPWGGRVRLGARRGAAVAACIAAACGVAAGPTIVAPAVRLGAAPTDWRIVACDIGQGDALLLRGSSTDGAAAPVMLVDTGEDEERLSACLSLFGVDRIAVLALSHDDRDHVGAVGAVAGMVDEALIAPSSADQGDSRPLLRRLDELGIPYRVGVAGLQDERGDLGWRVLAPRDGARPRDTNSASVMMLVDAGGISALMLGDSGSEQQRALRWRSSAAPGSLDVDVVKVAHHGSKDHDPELLQLAAAELGLISAGAGNSYGHPAPETLRSVAAAGTAALRTDLLGSIAISGAPGHLSVWAERPPQGCADDRLSECSNGPENPSSSAVPGRDSGASPQQGSRSRGSSSSAASYRLSAGLVRGRRTSRPRSWSSSRSLLARRHRATLSRPPPGRRAPRCAA